MQDAANSDEIVLALQWEPVDSMAKGIRSPFFALGFGFLVIAGGCSLPMAHLKSNDHPDSSEIGGPDRQFPQETPVGRPPHSSAGEGDVAGYTPGQLKRGPSQAAVSPQENRSQTTAQGQAPTNQVISVDLLVAELEAEGLLDPAAKAQLTADLCRTPPHLWQGVVEAFRAGLEIRKRRQSTSQLESTEVFIDDDNVQPASFSSTTSQTSLQNPQAQLEPPPEENQNRLATSSRPANTTIRDDPNLNSATNRPEASQAALRPASSSRQETSFAAAQQDSRRLLDRSALQEAGRSDSMATRPSSPFDDEDAADWEEWVKRGIHGLEDQQNRSSTEEIQLRLLHLALANREKTLDPIPSLSPSLQDFWSQTLFGILLLEDTHLHSDRQLRLMEARRHLENGIRRLGEECPLEVTGLAFVTSVQSWGVYDAFEQYEFSPGQKVLLYAEVENLASESTAKGYRTAWRSSYQILDATGKQIAQYEYPTNEEFCRRPRRDFFIGCELSFPKDAPPGRYTLRLTVVDMIKQRVGQGTVDFTIRAQPLR